MASAMALGLPSAHRAVGQIALSTTHTLDESEAFGLTAADGALYSVGTEGNCLPAV
jgi:hypothetical protein